MKFRLMATYKNQTARLQSFRDVCKAAVAGENMVRSERDGVLYSIVTSDGQPAKWGDGTLVDLYRNTVTRAETR